ncbi:flavin reductase family protein [Bacillus sp. FJAT-49736]|uniref:flavin reductase family protein n=1 Tax=Bacillus sp. FJAT-49736 TaxID=2833582 RepID=UPI001BCA51DA|nr:flavin reductase family protein [Bacillus sp. FJAT-49736]MBS4172340.1 flavin reductase family protein [Bacillus sp. FJAT-49736]
MELNQMATKLKHRTISPKILYYGTPVILLNTLNEDGTTNISPISSSWALGDCIVLGIGLGGKAMENLRRHKECVLNIPDFSLWKRVEDIAPYTGKNPVPEEKQKLGFSYKKNKFHAGTFTEQPSEMVQPSRINECSIQIEAEVKNIQIPEHTPFFCIVETKALKIHVREDLVVGGHHIDPEKWNPLIYNFRHYFGLGDPLGRTYRAEV